jgi:hypothetical protein
LKRQDTSSSVELSFNGDGKKIETWWLIFEPPEHVQSSLDVPSSVTGMSEYSNPEG